MFDNLRDSGDQFFYEEEQNDLYKEPEPAVAPAAPVYAAPRKRRKSNNARFLGMTAQQRFFLSLMFMITICIMGTLAMIVLGRMSLF